jgi:hypothetical protein
MFVETNYYDDLTMDVADDTIRAIASRFPGQSLEETIAKANKSFAEFDKVIHGSINQFFSRDSFSYFALHEPELAKQIASLVLPNPSEYPGYYSFASLTEENQREVLQNICDYFCKIHGMEKYQVMLVSSVTYQLDPLDPESTITDDTSSAWHRRDNRTILFNKDKLAFKEGSSETIDLLFHELASHANQHDLIEKISSLPSDHPLYLAALIFETEDQNYMYMETHGFAYALQAMETNALVIGRLAEETLKRNCLWLTRPPEPDQLLGESLMPHISRRNSCKTNNSDWMTPIKALFSRLLFGQHIPQLT